MRKSPHPINRLLITLIASLALQASVHGVTIGTPLDPVAHRDGTKMTDVDGGTGLGNQKGIMDINGDITNPVRSWDGYLRTVDEVADNAPETTFDLGQTTFIDISVSWNYLKTYSTTGLEKGQTWNITFASISGGNDHSLINADVAGDACLTSANTVGFVTIPEPNVAQILSIAGVFVLLTRRHRTRP